MKYIPAASNAPTKLPAPPTKAQYRKFRHLRPGDSVVLQPEPLAGVVKMHEPGWAIPYLVVEGDDGALYLSYADLVKELRNT